MSSLLNKNHVVSPADSAEHKAIPYTKILIKNLKMDMSIGVHDFERENIQTVIVSVEATVVDNPDWKEDSINDVLNYESIVSAIKFIGKRGHINLVETFAGHIADFCLKDPMVRDVKVTVEKPDIFEFMDSVAVEVFRSRS